MDRAGVEVPLWVSHERLVASEGPLGKAWPRRPLPDLVVGWATRATAGGSPRAQHNQGPPALAKPLGVHADISGGQSARRGPFAVEE